MTTAAGLAAAKAGTPPPTPALGADGTPTPERVHGARRRCSTSRPTTASCTRRPSAGHGIVFTYKWDAGRALELIEREGVTNFSGVPTMSRETADASRLGDARHVDAGGHGRRRRAAAARPRRQDRQVARGRACRAPVTDSPRRTASSPPTPVRCTWPSRRPAVGSSRRSSAKLVDELGNEVARTASANCACAARSSSRDISTARRRPRRPSRTVGSARATSPTSTRTGSCSSSTGPRTWCCAAARTSTAPRSKRRSTSIPAWPRWPCSACPTTGSARSSARRSCWRPASSLSEDELRAELSDTAGEVQGPRAGLVPQRVVAAQRQRQVRQARTAGDAARRNGLTE